MPPFWPFKRSKKNSMELDEEPPEAIVYRKDEEVHSEKHAQSIERNDAAYKDALALFGDGDTTVTASTNIADLYDGVTDASASESTSEWVHHTDGYHYEKKADGSFEPTPHVKQSDGSYVPYS
ncbi:hypothetical protein N9Y75_01620 [Candidatus Poseidoniales archaeon]|nr:hypothetical protein [Candidatus Poseidoniales archaeon]|tara:strand:+ start:751 stop:1119 length:369 start_codon:yes stop_codon:yes gene_type:complete